MAVPPPAMSLPHFSPTMSFDDASSAVLTFLHERLPMGFWSVTRVENGRQTYLHLDDRAYGLPHGGSHAWEDSFCRRMLAGDAPRVAPDVSGIPAYLEQGVGRQLTIGAYAGIPIVEPGGALFGTLCGMNETPMDATLVEEQGLLELLCQLLGMVLATDRARDLAVRAALEAQLAADTDPLTELYSRRAWDAIIAAEEARQRRFADPAVVALLDLDRLRNINDTLGHAAGDAYLRWAGEVLQAAAPDGTPIARVGGDEFALLLRDTTIEDADGVIATISAAMEVAEVAGSIGWGPHTVVAGFPGAMHVADERMREQKRRRRGVGVPDLGA